MSELSSQIRQKYINIKDSLNEKTKRLWFANESFEKGTTALLETKLVS